MIDKHHPSLRQPLCPALPGRWLCVAGLPRVCPFGDSVKFVRSALCKNKKALIQYADAIETGRHHPPSLH